MIGLRSQIIFTLSTLLYMLAAFRNATALNPQGSPEPGPDPRTALQKYMDIKPGDGTREAVLGPHMTDDSRSPRTDCFVDDELVTRSCVVRWRMHSPAKEIILIIYGWNFVWSAIIPSGVIDAIHDHSGDDTIPDHREDHLIMDLYQERINRTILGDPSLTDPTHDDNSLQACLIRSRYSPNDVLPAWSYWPMDGDRREMYTDLLTTLSTDVNRRIPRVAWMRPQHYQWGYEPDPRNPDTQTYLDVAFASRADIVSEDGDVTDLIFGSEEQWVAWLDPALHDACEEDAEES